MKKSNYRFVAAALLAGCFYPALAHAKDEALPKFDQYLDCVRNVSIDARQAYDTASRWRASGGGAKAMHCEALALSGMGVYPSAAKLLIRIAEFPETTELEHKAELYAQAGHAYLLADRAGLAIKTFGRGLDHVDLNSAPGLASDLHVSRAQGFGVLEKWDEARADLNLVLAVLPQHYEALLLRASLRRTERNFAAAAGDLVNYLILRPDDPDGLLERGLLKMDVLDVAGARGDFERVVALDPESLAAAEARTALAKIAFREDSRQMFSEESAGD